MRRCSHPFSRYLVLLALLAGLTAGCRTLPLEIPLPDFLARQEAAQEEPIQLRWGGGATSPGERELIQAQLARFQATEERITVEARWTDNLAETLPGAQATGEAPDVFLATGNLLPQLVADQALVILPNDWIPTADLYPGLEGAWLQWGTTACLPRDLATLALVYNRERFDSAGLTYPDSSWGWQELYNAAAALTDANNGLYGLVLAADISRWLPFVYQAGGRLLSADGQTLALHSPEALTATEFFLSLFQEGLAVTPDQLDSTWNGEGFGRGRAAMTLEANWIVSYLAAEFPELRYGVAELPAGPAGRATLAFTTCYAVAASSPHRNEAVALADFLSQPGHLAEWAEHTLHLPGRRTLLPSWRAAHPDLDAFARGVDYAQLWQLPPPLQGLIPLANSDLQAAMDGDLTAQELLDQLNARGQRALGTGP